jgi:hypothetical protein
VPSSIARTLDILELGERDLVLGKGRAAAIHVVSEACFRFQSDPLFRYQLEVAYHCSSHISLWETTLPAWQVGA